VVCTLNGSVLAPPSAGLAEYEGLPGLPEEVFDLWNWQPTSPTTTSSSTGDTPLTGDEDVLLYPAVSRGASPNSAGVLPSPHSPSPRGAQPPPPTTTVPVQPVVTWAWYAAWYCWAGTYYIREAGTGYGDALDTNPPP
jgi:hypothetical protein